MSRRRSVAVLVAVVLLVSGAPHTLARAQADSHALLDRVLDVYVRDGYVYYHALRIERANLDRYVASLDVSPADLARMDENDRHAFWVNAYNALVLRTVINAYPIHGTGDGFPASSVGQIPGAFSRVKHRVAGQVLTLDEIETQVIAGFGDGRFVFALGRGTIGSARLRSEVYRGARLDDQLNEAVEEFVRRTDNITIDRTNDVLTMTPLFSWREDLLVNTVDGRGQMWSNRSPLERAVAAMAYPHLFPSEREFLARNTFRMQFGEYDWRLNDLTGGIPRQGESQ
ncbi:MAG: DUF547 domain-containing protein [Acidobacteria bacterium]|jgi:hypothetical protein|nr:DUF547 domain-containing protein [Acidobacteriota bacterium]